MTRSEDGAASVKDHIDSMVGGGDTDDGERASNFSCVLG